MSDFSREDLAVMASAFGCDERLLDVIARLVRHSFAPSGRRLYPTAEGDETILLLAGRAHELAYGRDGGVMVVHTIGRGELFGDLLSSAEGRSGEVQAVVYSRCGHMASTALVRLMENYSAVAMAVARQIAGKVTAMRERMVETALLSARGRLCSEIARMAEQGEGNVIAPAPVVSDLALIARTTRETASRTISYLLKRGILVREDHALRVVAMHRLREMIA